MLRRGLLKTSHFTSLFNYVIFVVKFGKQMDKETKLRIHNITANAAVKFRSEVWVLKKREEQRLEAAQMKFLRHLLGITKLLTYLLHTAQPFLRS